MNVTVDVDDEKYPLADHGRPGSLLDIALAHDISLEHNCGGSCACTTCHVIVRQGDGNLSEMEDDEAANRGRFQKIEDGRPGSPAIPCVLKDQGDRLYLGHDRAAGAD